MKAKQLIAAVAVFAAAGSVFAQQTELKQARANGGYVVGGREYVAPDANYVSTKTRAQVMSELEQSKADGSYDLAHQEYEGQFPGLNNGGNSSTRFAGSGKAENVH